MQITSVLFAIAMSVTIVSGQFFGSYDNSYRFGYDSSASLDDSSSGSSFGGFGGSRFRDPRQNRGPVQFPSPPTDGPVESSGVIVGASGYGFVPPNGPSKYSSSSSSGTPNRFNNRYFNQFRFF